MYKVIRIRGKYILAHGTENKMPHWEVRTCLPYCCEEILLGLRPYCCGELHRPYCCEELHVSQARFEETLGFGLACASDGERELED
jgi:hypothetical protein